MATRAHLASDLPVRIGSYLIHGVIGQGGMGVVYRGKHQATGSFAAVKTVRLRKEAHLAGIRRELHALVELRHPAIVRVLGHGIEGDLPWYAMELLEGETLADYLRRAWAEGVEARTAAAGRLQEALTVARRI